MSPAYSVAVVDRFSGGRLDLGSALAIAGIGLTRQFGVSTAAVSWSPSARVVPDLARLVANPDAHHLVVGLGADTLHDGPIDSASEETIEASCLLGYGATRTLPDLVSPLAGDASIAARWAVDAALNNPIDPIAHALRVELVGVERTITALSSLRPTLDDELDTLTGGLLRWTCAVRSIYGLRVTATAAERGPAANAGPDGFGGTPIPVSSATDRASVVWARSGTLLARHPGEATVLAGGLREVVVDAPSTITDLGELRAFTAQEWERRRLPTFSLDVDALPPSFPLAFSQLVPGVRVTGGSAPSARVLVAGLFELQSATLTVGATGGGRRTGDGAYSVPAAATSASVQAAWASVPGEVRIVDGH